MARAPKKSKRFSYNLKSVLKYREICESQEQEKFTEAERTFLEELRKEEDIKTQKHAEYLDLVEQMGAGQTLDFQRLEMRRGHLDILKERLYAQSQVREDAEEAKEIQREKLIDAMKDRKILEKDRENKQKIWKKLMDKEEIKFLDDIATMGYERKRRQLE